MATRKPKANPTEDLLAEVRERLSLCISVEGQERREAVESFAFVFGDQWPDDMRRIRQVEQRPALTNNRLPAFVHQVTNDIRQNRPGIKVHPVDDGADRETADVLQGMIRHIEYASNADFAYDTSVAHGVIGGKGYFRLITDYCEDDTFDQDIKFLRVPNPFTVYWDPWSTEPDGSDSRFVIITDMIPRGDFRRDYPEAKANDVTDLQSGTGDGSTMWLSTESVRVAEYYRVEVERKKLLRLSTGENVWADEVGELPPEVVIERERMADRRKVMLYKVTGVDVLESSEVPCRWIPVFPVYGEEHIVNNRITRCGMIKHAKDPMRMFNFWTTSATEEVSLRPKTPFIGAVGQFETAKTSWQQANRRSFSFLEYDPVEVGGGIAPPPQRQPMADVPAGAIQMLALAESNIKATMGLFDASLGARGNASSGRQELLQQKEGDTATFHFTDNLSRTIRHVGRCMLSMIPRVYDTQRVIRIMGEDDEVKSAPLNQPLEQPIQKEDGAIQTVLNDLSVGRYDVTVSTGPSYQTKRQEQADAMLNLGQAAPMLWQAAGDLLVKSMDWNGADEIAERLKRAIPPQIRGEDEEQGQLPPQVVQVLQQAQAEIQQLQQALAEAQTGMDKERLKAEVSMAQEQLRQETARYVAELNADSRRDVEELKGMIALILQQIQPPPTLAAEVGADMGKDSQPTGGGTA